MSLAPPGFWEVTLRHSLALPTPMARRFTRPRPSSFRGRRSGACCRRGSDFASRPDDADGAHELGSHAVLLIAKYMLDTGAHLRAGRVGGLLRLTASPNDCNRGFRTETHLEVSSKSAPAPNWKLEVKHRSAPA